MPNDKNIKININVKPNLNWKKVADGMARAVRAAGVSMADAAKAAKAFSAPPSGIPDDIPEASKMLKDAVEGAAFLKCPQCGAHKLDQYTKEVVRIKDISVKDTGKWELDNPGFAPQAMGWQVDVLGYRCPECDKYYRLVDGQLAETDVDYFMKGGR